MEIEELIKKQKEFFNTNKTKDIKFRKDALRKLRNAILKYEKDIEIAIRKDLNKSSSESYMVEIGICLSEISYMLKHIGKWSKEKRVLTPISQFHAKSFESPEPYGTVLIISPWNYPFMLSIDPLIDAISAGNCVILKPSEFSPNTSLIMEKIIKEIFDEEFVSVVQGDKDVCTKLLEQKVDYIFYTGGNRVGKIVMQEAAKNLIPVTLELGGKSPCIVDKTANLEIAAKRILFGKILNAGQTCVAPDYLLVQKDVKEKLISYFIKYIREFLGNEPIENQNYAHIINDRHFKRIMNLLEGEKILIGGKINKQERIIEPTFVDGNFSKKELLEEEIFGPIMPVFTYDNIDEAINFVKQKEKPLAFYLFTADKKIEKKVLNEISFGGGCINDTIIHLATSRLGFGGVGNSGMGAYHGKKGFDTFTHYRSIVKKYTWIDLPMRYMPYTKIKDKMIRTFLR